MQQFYLTREDSDGVGEYDSIAWAFEVHVKQPDTGEYNAAIFYGNEDAPNRIEFYIQAEPNVTDKIAFIWLPVTPVKTPVASMNTEPTDFDALAGAIPEEDLDDFIEATHYMDCGCHSDRREACPHGGL